MFARRRTLQPPNHDPAFLPLNVVPSQAAEFADTQAVVEGQPDRGGIACTVPVSARGLAQRQNFIAAQMLARTALLVGDAHRPEASCSIFGVCGCRLDHLQGGWMPRLLS